MECFATCPAGFERLLAGELASLGIAQVRPLKGQVTFESEGSLEAAYRACLWSRLASRVELVLARGASANADELYETISSIPWEDHLSTSTTFAVDANGTNDQLRNTNFVALRTKDAIADRLVAKRGGRPSIDTSRPDVRISVRLRRDRATVAIDLSGEALFRRGYDRAVPVRQAFAPLRPDYAAALLAAGAWHRACRHDSPALAVPFSGQGTVIAEAAAIALDRAPGLLRASWGFEGWLGHDPEVWDRLVAEADDRAEQGSSLASEKPGSMPALLAGDVRPRALASTRATLRAAGIGLPVGDLASADLSRCGGNEGRDLLVVCDLSWLRDGDAALEAQALSNFSSLAGDLGAEATVAALSRDAAVDAVLGREPSETLAVYVGQDQGTIRTYSPASTRGDAAGTADVTGGDESGSAATSRPAGAATITLRDGSQVGVLVPASDQFAARLAKVAKLRRKWAAREGITCYRVYDADLPDYAVSIDLYEGAAETPGRWLVIAEYAPPKDIDREVAHRRLLDVLAIAPRVLGIEPRDVTLRTREKARGGSQYADAGTSADARGGRDGRAGSPGRSSRQAKPHLPAGCHLVEEGGLTFEVDLSSHLDTGLFLDHRDVRAEVRELAKTTLGSKRFLNLFAYTGTATCYAADGGAKHTTTVDLSPTYLEVARRNMARNGFTGAEHEFVQADVVDWVSEQRHTANRWDLVFCDPPTFSNSSRMRGASFDVQRDHAELLIGISRILTRNGICLFSCNLRTFEPDIEKLARAGVVIEDVTEGTIPEDFARNARIHHCYLVRRG